MGPKIPDLVVTNPFWIWAFKHGIEDPSWGTRTIDQHTIALAILDIAEKISDGDTRRQIKASASKLLLDTAHAIDEESRSAK
jgi:hypothetical protein